MSEIEELKEICMKIAEDIEDRVREEKQKNFRQLSQELYMGADGTPTQRIDKIAEDIALSTVSKKMNVLSEEAGFVDYGCEYTMVIDPVDGTRNAVHGIPFYCTSIAIGKEKLSDVKYALVRNLLTGDTYTAEKGKGAFLNGSKIEVEKTSNEPIFSLALGKSGNNRMFNLLNINRLNIRSLGAAALEMCLIASGSIHAYIQGNDYLRVTDFAASTLIVREAGGEVFDIRGKLLDTRLNLKERSSVIAVSSEEFLEGIL
ncbi:MAG: inositol monophosphatase [Thermoplasmata archaeon]|nr:MAG: inositol monophosphatase [Thermoplasmata archaeon]